MTIPFLTTEKEIQLKQLLLFYSSRIDRAFVAAHKSSRKKIVIALAADYGNLGDVAITMAQQRFLEERYPDRDVILLPISETFTKMRSLKHILTPEDLITTVGGGNTGDMYADIEFARQFILRQFPKNQIITFPQTVDYQDPQRIKKDLKHYACHPHLTVSVREARSQAFYQQHLAKGAALLPDIVLTLGERYGKGAQKRENILICLRKDAECGVRVNPNILEALQEKAPLVFRDTQVDCERLPLAKGMTEVDQLLRLFQQKKLVVTDRLHGMIFACITGTPCIALDNKNKKISGVYHCWLAEKTNIHVFEKEPTTTEFMAKAAELLDQVYTPPKYKPAFSRFFANTFTG